MLRIFILLFISFLFSLQAAFADMGEADTLGEEQIKEKQELKQMHDEVGDIKSTINEAESEMQNLTRRMTQPAQEAKEFHLFAREDKWETYSGVKVRALTYNGKIPGPVIRVQEGNLVKVVLHNQMKVPTSLTFHGLIVPHTVGGIPRAGAGLVGPGESYAFVFQANQAGTYWYHPQIIHPGQRQLGLYGAMVVEPRPSASPYDKDITIVFSELVRSRTPGVAAPGNGKVGSATSEFTAIASTDKSSQPGLAKEAGLETDYLMNGKPAPYIEPIELRRGERVRMRLINAGHEAVPLFLSGHKLEVVAVNGGDRLEPHVFRDTLTLNPSDRCDVDFRADNPGVWSLASELAHQCTFKGKFPGGMACVVRYSELKRPPAPPAKAEPALE